MKLHFIIFVALAVVLSGCATQYVHHHYEPQFLPETGDAAIPASCRVVLNQDDPFVAAQKTQAYKLGITGPGLIDIAVTLGMNAVMNGENNAADKAREDKATETIAPLLGHGIGALFRKEFESSLSAVLLSSPWLHSMPLEMAGGTTNVLASEVISHPVVHINSIYYLSYDASTLIIQAQLLYFHQSQTNAAYYRLYTYYSNPVGPEKDEEAIKKWAASGQKLFLSRMNEGINEVAAMLKLDFFQPEPVDPTTSGARISCFDAVNLNRVQWEGHIIRKGEPRILFQDKAGNLFSIIPDAIVPDTK